MLSALADTLLPQLLCVLLSFRFLHTRSLAVPRFPLFPLPCWSTPSPNLRYIRRRLPPRWRGVSTTCDFHEWSAAPLLKMSFCHCKAFFVTLLLPLIIRAQQISTSASTVCRDERATSLTWPSIVFKYLLDDGRVCYDMQFMHCHGV
jgi:hypothetical protein